MKGNKGTPRNHDRKDKFGGSLRKQAEKRMSERERGTSPLMNQEEMQKLIHELQVHQIELEIQNEELVRARHEIEAGLGRYTQLYDFAPVGYLTLIDNGIITEANLTAAMLLDVERKSLVGARFSRFIASEDQDRWSRFCEGLVHNDTSQTCNLTLVRKDRSSFPVRLDSTLITSIDGEIPAMMVAFNDITDIRKTEDALHLSNKKLGLLSSITRHDVNNQLIILNAYLEMVKNKATSPALEHDFSRITNAAERISKIVEFTKEYEKIGVNAPTWQNIHELVDTARMQIIPRPVTVQNGIPADSELFADSLVVKVFSSLIENAVRHRGKITTVWFSLQESGDHYHIICEDDGDGVASGEKELIFTRGYGKNTGLGLTLSQEILAITGISIRETGEPGKGARFEILVPKGGCRFKNR